MSRALLVIDVQNEYFTGALPITHPAGHLEQILATMDAASEGNVPTVVVQHHFEDTSMPFFQKDSTEWQLHAEVEERPHDLLVQKTRTESAHRSVPRKRNVHDHSMINWVWETHSPEACLSRTQYAPVLLSSRVTRTSVPLTHCSWINRPEPSNTSKEPSEACEMRTTNCPFDGLGCTPMVGMEVGQANAFFFDDRNSMKC